MSALRGIADEFAEALHVADVPQPDIPPSLREDALFQRGKPREVSAQGFPQLGFSRVSHPNFAWLHGQLTQSCYDPMWENPLEFSDRTPRAGFLFAPQNSIQHRPASNRGLVRRHATCHREPGSPATGHRFDGRTGLAAASGVGMQTLRCEGCFGSHSVVALDATHQQKGPSPTSGGGPLARHHRLDANRLLRPPRFARAGSGQSGARPRNRALCSFCGGVNGQRAFDLDQRRPLQALYSPHVLYRRRS
jgi:hypothetical protein